MSVNTRSLARRIVMALGFLAKTWLKLVRWFFYRMMRDWQQWFLRRSLRVRLAFVAGWLFYSIPAIVYIIAKFGMPGEVHQIPNDDYLDSFIDITAAICLLLFVTVFGGPNSAPKKETEK